uniref:Uncharacterized protein n=1 Tax=Ornithorhynchus anatinus TaxID=9258 RepID=A0A6I8P476_ORNAN
MDQHSGHVESSHSHWGGDWRGVAVGGGTHDRELQGKVRRGRGPSGQLCCLGLSGALGELSRSWDLFFRILQFQVVPDEKRLCLAESSFLSFHDSDCESRGSPPCESLLSLNTEKILSQAKTLAEQKRFPFATDNVNMNEELAIAYVLIGSGLYDEAIRHFSSMLQVSVLSSLIRSSIVKLVAPGEPQVSVCGESLSGRRR